MNVRTETHRSVRIDTGGGTTLKVTRTGDAIVLAHGLGGDGEPFRRPDWCGTPMRLPASVVADLIAALEALNGLVSGEPPAT